MGDLNRVSLLHLPVNVTIFLMSLPPPVQLELRGTSHEIGKQHGTQLSTQIRRQIKVYTSMFLSTSNMDWDAVRRVAQVYQETIARLCPDILEEIKGIAEGAGEGIDVLDVIALNARSEIALGLFSDGCTSLGWNTSGGEVYLAQNWDWVPDVQENLALVSIEKAGAPKVFIITEAGIVGKIGFNNAGVGVCLNAIRAHPTDSSKLPIHIALRVCLESTSIQSARKKLEALGGVASTQHILIADGSGPLGMELSPLGNGYIHPNKQGIVTHTNHLVANRSSGLKEPPWIGTGTRERLERVNHLLSSWNKDLAVTPESLRRFVFADRTSDALGCSICAEGNPENPVEKRWRTLFNIVIVLKQDEPAFAEVVWGRPGSSEEGPMLRMPWK